MSGIGLHCNLVIGAGGSYPNEGSGEDRILDSTATNGLSYSESLGSVLDARRGAVPRSSVSFCSASWLTSERLHKGQLALIPCLRIHKSMQALPNRWPQGSVLTSSPSSNSARQIEHVASSPPSSAPVILRCRDTGNEAIADKTRLALAWLLCKSM